MDPNSVVEIEFVAQQVGEGRQAVEAKYVITSFFYSIFGQAHPPSLINYSCSYSWLTTIEKFQRRGRVYEATGGHENKVCVYESELRVVHMATCGCGVRTVYSITFVTDRSPANQGLVDPVDRGNNP